MERPRSTSPLRSGPLIGIPELRGPFSPWDDVIAGDTLSSVSGDVRVGVGVSSRADRLLELPQMPLAHVLPIVFEDRLRIRPSALAHQRRDVVSPSRRSGPPERARRDPVRVMLPEDLVRPRPIPMRASFSWKQVVRHAGLA